MLEVSQISQAISDAAQISSKIIFGVSQIKEKDKVEIVLLALGCEIKDFFLGFKKPKPRFQKTKGKKILKILEPEKKEMDSKAEKALEAIGSVKKKIQGRPKKKKAEKKAKNKPLNAKFAQKQEPPREKAGEIKKQTLILKGEKNKEEKNKAKIRKNALQVQKDVQALEEELIKKEEIWEAPAFLRKKI